MTLPAISTASKRRPRSTSTRSPRTQVSSGALAVAFSNMDGSRSTPTTSRPRRASSMATRPVPQPASSTDPTAPPSEITKSASPWMFSPSAASSAHRLSYVAARPSPSANQRERGSSRTGPDCTTMTTSAPDPVPLVPRQVLFGNPERVSPRISPDGTRLAWIAPDEEVLNVWVTPVGSWQARPVTKDRDRGIRSYFWAHDNRHLLYVQDKGGDENWRLYAVDLDTDEIRDLTPFDDVQARIEEVDKH